MLNGGPVRAGPGHGGRELVVLLVKQLVQVARVGKSEGAQKDFVFTNKVSHFPAVSRVMSYSSLNLRFTFR